MLLLQAVANSWDTVPEPIKGLIGAAIVILCLVFVLAKLANPNNRHYFKQDKSTTTTSIDPKDIDDPMEGKMW